MQVTPTAVAHDAVAVGPAVVELPAAVGTAVVGPDPQVAVHEVWTALVGGVVRPVAAGLGRPAVPAAVGLEQVVAARGALVASLHAAGPPHAAVKPGEKAVPGGGMAGPGKGVSHPGRLSVGVAELLPGMGRRAGPGPGVTARGPVVLMPAAGTGPGVTAGGPVVLMPAVATGRAAGGRPAPPVSVKTARPVGLVVSRRRARTGIRRGAMWLEPAPRRDEAGPVAGKEPGAPPYGAAQRTAERSGMPDLSGRPGPGLRCPPRSRLTSSTRRRGPNCVRCRVISPMLWHVS